MRKLITAAVLSIIGTGVLIVAVLLASHSVDADSAFLSSVSGVAVVVGLLAILVALLERSHQRVTGPSADPLGTDRVDDRDDSRVRDELRAIGFGGVPRT